MLIANAVICMAHRIDGDLAVLMRERNQLAARMIFGRAAFVGVNVRVIAAQHRVIWTVQRLQPEHVRACAVEGKEDVDTVTEVFFKLGNRRSGVRIVSVSNYMPLIGAGNSFEHLGMDSGIVVAGKAARRLGENLWHKKTM